jgi:dTDP-4-dehydrorhamnose reductase
MFLILGSTGYIGSKISHFLTTNEREVLGISRSEIDYTSPKILKEFLRSKNQDF